MTKLVTEYLEIETTRIPERWVFIYVMKIAEIIRE